MKKSHAINHEISLTIGLGTKQIKCKMCNIMNYKCQYIKMNHHFCVIVIMPSLNYVLCLNAIGPEAGSAYMSSC